MAHLCSALPHQTPKVRRIAAHNHSTAQQAIILHTFGVQARILNFVKLGKPFCAGLPQEEFVRKGLTTFWHPCCGIGGNNGSDGRRPAKWSVEKAMARRKPKTLVELMLFGHATPIPEVRPTGVPRARSESYLDPKGM